MYRDVILPMNFISGGLGPKVAVNPSGVIVTARRQGYKEIIL